MRFRRRDIFTGLSCITMGFFAERILRSRSKENAIELEGFAFRERPLAINPHGELCEFVKMEELSIFLSKLAPSWYKIKTSMVLHAFRLWGQSADFPIDKFSHIFPGRILSGRELCGYLFDINIFRKYSPGKSLLADSEYGVSARTSESNLGDLPGISTDPFAHTNDLLCTCAELGLDLEFSCNLQDNNNRSLRSLLTHAIATFDPMDELEFTCEAFARYLAPCRFWYDRFGRKWSFDDIASKLLKRPLGEGVCLGIHNVHALVVLLAVNIQYPIISRVTAAAIREYVLAVSASIAATALQSGMWSGNWVVGSNLLNSIPRADAFAAMLATGHHLEWIALAPRDLRPRAELVKLSIRACLEYVLKLSDYEITDAYLPLSHFARSLCQISNTTAWSLFENNPEKK